VKIAPRLKNKRHRLPTYSGLPPEIRLEIERLARVNGCSRSWVIERIILEWAGVKVRYISKNVESLIDY